MKLGAGNKTLFDEAKMSGRRQLWSYVVIFVVAFTLASFINFGESKAGGVESIPVVYKSLLETNVGGVETCKERLDRIDAIADEKRRVRQDFSWNSTYKPKNDNANMDMWEPEAVCFSEERFGQTKGFSGSGHLRRYQAFGDGPKFLCGVDLMSAEAARSREDGSDNCLVYNVGSHNQIDYEVSVHEYIGCEVHTFDPTVSSDVYLGKAYSYFHEWGLGLDGEEMDFYLDGKQHHWVNKGFDQIVEALGHKGRKIDMLKIDCEGCGKKPFVHSRRM